MKQQELKPDSLPRHDATHRCRCFRLSLLNQASWQGHISVQSAKPCTMPCKQTTRWSCKKKNTDLRLSESKSESNSARPSPSPSPSWASPSSPACAPPRLESTLDDHFCGLHTLRKSGQSFNTAAMKSATQRHRFSYSRAENKRKVLAASVSLTADPRTQVAMRRSRRRLLHSKDSKFFSLRHNSSQPRNTVCMLAHKLCMMCNVPAIVRELGKTKAVAGAGFATGGGAGGGGRPGSSGSSASMSTSSTSPGTSPGPTAGSGPSTSSATSD